MGNSDIENIDEEDSGEDKANGSILSKSNISPRININKIRDPLIIPRINEVRLEFLTTLSKMWF